MRRQICAPPDKMSAKYQLQKENYTIAEHVSIAIDKHGKRRILVSLPISEEAAKVLLKGSNRTQALAEVDAKKKKQGRPEVCHNH